MRSPVDGLRSIQDGTSEQFFQHKGVSNSEIQSNVGGILYYLDKCNLLVP